MNVDTKNEEIASKNILTITNNIKGKNKMYECIKRVIDIVCSVIGLIILIPLTIIIWIANFFVKDKGTVFYVQERIGKDGKLFKLYKYRSMVVNADEKLTKYLEENEEAKKEYKKYKKLENDPRVTFIGKIIRKTSIDEFPQFINIFKGDMSLVGPRPYLPREIKDMQENYDEIIKVKPGLTGLWQVNGRNDTTFEERMIIDKEYVEKRNVILDIKIIIRTFMKVFIKEGAK